MDSLYARLARHWDELFPPDSEREAFLDGLIPEKGRVLELGCGSGATAKALASLGRSVWATDLDEAMVHHAKSTASGLFLNTHHGFPPEGHVHFSVADMLGGMQEIHPEQAHVILCLGNTLPHLESGHQLAQFFQHAYDALLDDGILVVQMLDYTNIRDQGALQLPLLSAGGLEFYRSQRYDPERGRIIFETLVKDSQTQEERQHYLTPFTPGALTGYAAEKGFSDGQFLGNWHGEDFDGHSSWFVALFRKKVRES